MLRKAGIFDLAIWIIMMMVASVFKSASLLEDMGHMLKENIGISNSAKKREKTRFHSCHSQQAINVKVQFGLV